MLQFNTYKTTEALRAEADYALNVRRLLSEHRDVELETFVRQQFGTASLKARHHLINCRLALWRLIPPDYVSEAVKYALRNRSNLSLFDLTEIFGSSQALCPNLPDLADDIWDPLRLLCSSSDVESESAAVSPAVERVWNGSVSYIPPRSGFFSVIENLLNAIFFAQEKRLRLHIPPESFWWSYPVGIENFFYDHISSGLLHWGSNLGDAPLSFDDPRNFIATGDLGRLKKFIAFKEGFYRRFLFSAISFIKSVSDDAVSWRLGEPVIYLRAGDKLNLETVRIPRAIRDDAVRKLIGVLDRPLLVISDSYDEAEELAARFEKHNVLNLTPRRFRGYFHRKDGNSFEDLIAIFHNFCLLASSPIAISDPSSNLVNAAHWAKSSALISQDLTICRYVPISRYFLF